jgi:hypothetical protein
VRTSQVMLLHVESSLRHVNAQRVRLTSRRFQHSSTIHH